MVDFKEKIFKLDYLGKELVVKTGTLAQQSNFSCTVQYGDTVILANANMAKQAREDIDYFPLMIDYEEKFYASGKIKGKRWRRKTRLRN